MSNEEPAHAHDGAPACQVCPICMGLATLRQARPEALEHLMKAGAELMLAARAFLDVGTEAAGPARRPGGMQRIRVG